MTPTVSVAPQNRPHVFSMLSGARWCRFGSILWIIGAFLLLAPVGRAAPTLSVRTLTSSLTYQPARWTDRIGATIRLELSHTLGPKMLAAWHRPGINEQTIANYRQAVVNVMANDIVESGMFTKVEPSPPSPDFVVRLVSKETMDPVPTLVINAQVLTPEGQVVSDHTEQSPMGTTVLNYKLKETLPKVMHALKTRLFADTVTFIRQRREQTDRAEAAAIAQADLPGLLVSSERSVSSARERNRALIAAKDRQLPGLLRNSKTEELTSLLVRIEQTLFDLNHEGELTKDRAQQAAAASADPGQIGALRELSICYRERVELLKPIAAAIREEIANRRR